MSWRKKEPKVSAKRLDRKLTPGAPRLNRKWPPESYVNTRKWNPEAGQGVGMNL